jgi:hypothetical protein
VLGDETGGGGRVLVTLPFRIASPSARAAAGRVTE